MAKELIPLFESFFARDTVLVAVELLGKIMSYKCGNTVFSGRVVETEAYLGVNDPSCHSAKGMTKRNASMFGKAGRSYIYLIYGMYLCYNVTTDQEQIPAAVLLRALQPLTGIEQMQAVRPQAKTAKLCSGPGNLAKCMHLTKALDGTAIGEGINFYDDGYQVDAADIVRTERVGISAGQDLQLRFYLANQPAVSRK